MGEDKLKEIEQKILTENRKILLRNAFLGKFDRSQMREVDNAIAIVKEGKAETGKALEERQKEIKAAEREHLEAKMKVHLKHKKQQRGKQEKKKGKKKKAKQQQQQQQQATNNNTTATTTTTATTP